MISVGDFDFSKKETIATLPAPDISIELFCVEKTWFIQIQSEGSLQILYFVGEDEARNRWKRLYKQYKTPFCRDCGTIMVRAQKKREVIDDWDKSKYSVTDYYIVCPECGRREKK